MDSAFMSSRAKRYHLLSILYRDEIPLDLIRSMQRVFGFTAVMVSHEIPKVFLISDWVAMLKHGQIAAMAPSNEFPHLENPVVQEFIAVDDVVTSEV